MRGYWDGEDTGADDGGDRPPEPVSNAEQAPAPPKPPISSRDLPWDEFPQAPGFTDRNKHLTFAAVGEGYHVGVLIEGPPPGMRSCPKHYHMLEEEHAIILEGDVTLLLGDESHRMRPGDYVCFPAGRKVGHSFLNSGAGPCAYLMIGERNPNEVCIYPDSGKLFVRSLDENGADAVFDLRATRKYWDGDAAD